MAKKKATKKTSAKKAASMEMLLVGSKVKAALRSHGVNVGEGTLDALNGMLYWYVEQAAKRAQANKRKTVRGHDVALM
jgi:histone H3/H4